MSPSRTIALQDMSSGALVPAQLIEQVDSAYAHRADDSWLSFIAAQTACAPPEGLSVSGLELQHAHWRWEQKVQSVGSLLSYPTLGIECAGEVQGLMLLRTDGEFGRLAEQLHHPIVYVVFLAAAPWNLPAVVAEPRFRGVGTALLRAAVEISGELGFKGRVGLHSLPQSEAFYHRYGMRCLGIDEDKERLNYFEMDVDTAAAFIR